MRIYQRGALRLSTNFFVTRHLSTSAEIALSCKTCRILTHLNWWMICLQERTLTTWFGSMSGGGDRVRSRLCVRQIKAEGPRDDLFAGTPDTFYIKYLLA